MNCACGCGSEIVTLGAARYDITTGKWYYRAHFNAMKIERQEAHVNPSIEQYKRDKMKMEVENNGTE